MSLPKIIPVTKGGTGAATASDALTNLGAEAVANKSTDVNADGSSNVKYPSVKAVKDYADGLVVGLLDYRGAYDASTNLFPATGGSGTAGAVLKGDTWVISVAGTLGGTAIQVGDSIIANVDTPGQTAGNWNTLNTNIGYVPEDSANKVTSVSGASTDVQYPSAKLLYDQIQLLLPIDNSGTQRTILMLDNDGAAIIFKEGATSYLGFDTRNGIENVYSAIVHKFYAGADFFGTVTMDTPLGVGDGGTGSDTPSDSFSNLFVWTEVTGTSQTAATNNGYIANNAALVTITLPATAAVGKTIKIVGKGAGLWKIAQAAGQTIHVGNVNTTTGAGGSVTATNRYDSIELVCTTANTDYVVSSSTGSFTIV